MTMGRNLIEQYRGGLECGGSQSSVIRRLAESYGMSDEDVKQLMLDAGLKPYELPKDMQKGFYEKPRAFAEVEPPPALRGHLPTREAGESAAAGRQSPSHRRETPMPAPFTQGGLGDGGEQIGLAAGASPCPTSNDGEGPWETRYLQKPFPHFADGRAKPTGEGSGLIDRKKVLEKLREKCRGCDNYNEVRCRWCETGRAIKIVKEEKDV